MRKNYDRVIGIYDSAEMKLNKATTFWVPAGMTNASAYTAVMKTEEYMELNAKCLGDNSLEGDVGRGDVGMAIWELPHKVQAPEGLRLG